MNHLFRLKDMELLAVSRKTQAYVYRHKHGRLPDGVTEQGLEDEIRQREDAIINLEKTMNDGTHGIFTGVAFVSFQIESMKQEILKRYSVSSFQRFRNAFPLIANRDFSQGLVMKGNQRLYVSQAAEPGDVYWKNLHLSDRERYFRKLCGYVFSGILLYLCALMIYYLLIQQNDLKNESKGEKGDAEAQLKVQALTILLAVVIVAINKVLAFIIPYIASLGYITFSNLNFP